MQGKPLTAKALDALKPAPAGRRTTIADAGLRGFQVRVTDSGIRTFSFRYRFNGKQHRVSLGRYPATGLAEAHDAARAILQALEHGEDPKAAPITPAQQGPTGRTVRAVVAKFVTEFLGEHERRTAHEMQRILERELLPKLGDRDIKSIDQGDIEDVIIAVRDRARKEARDRALAKAAGAVYAEAAAEERDRAAREGRNPDFRRSRRAATARADAAREAAREAAEQAARKAGVSANRVHAVIRRLWNWAREEKRYVLDNPAKFRRKVEERPRSRVLSADEIRAVWGSCAEIHPAFRDVIRILLLTGQRLNEIARLTWQEFHEEAGELRLSGDRTKNRRPHIIPLSEAARTIIAGRDRIENCPYIFTTTGKTPVSGFSSWKDKLDERLGFDVPWRLHDLRHIVVTGMAELEIEPHVIEAVVNHVSGAKAGVAGVYNNFSYLPQKRAALARWAAHVERIIAPPTGKVIRLHAGAAAEGVATA